MKLLWLGYLVYSLGNCAIKLYIETDLIDNKSIYVKHVSRKIYKHQKETNKTQ